MKCILKKFAFSLIKIPIFYSTIFKLFNVFNFFNPISFFACGVNKVKKEQKWDFLEMTL